MLGTSRTYLAHLVNQTDEGRDGAEAPRPPAAAIPPSASSSETTKRGDAASVDGKHPLQPASLHESPEPIVFLGCAVLPWLELIRTIWPIAATITPLILICGFLWLQTKFAPRDGAR
jgi:hypothetical protein